MKGDGHYFIQEDIDEYFAKKKDDDEKLPADKKESQAVQRMRKSALKFLLKDVLKLDIEFKDYSTKSVR